ncbi:BspA family leucine-rich repeat surface protein [Bifidobacterium sp. ESL0790]|uniref:BspA family leucine-rich repeat surface protein n=1 Tax=Bifidobacterium sp. ESL0790 TaxID=2983233 RepID=UPI0023F9C9DB|nr:BspA family leucine-rich repeat surface protein [Bifidobacterium sp. ESL0790]WEV71842.1 BspA family leucine-rich repeat surface protein [Bifidobacterium sp. ESL0790]
MGPQSSCTPTTATWQGSAYGGPTTDHIDWTINSACQMTVTGGSLSYDYYYIYFPWLENGYDSKVTSLTINNLTLQPGVTNMYHWFSDMGALGSFSAPNLDTSNIRDLRFMFDSSSHLSSANLSGWKTGNVYSMWNTFVNNTALSNLNIDGWDFSKVTNAIGMFGSCNSLNKLKMTNWKTSQTSAASLSTAIKSAPAATSVDLSNLNTGNATNLADLFKDSNASTTITEYDLTGWNLPQVTDLSDLFYDNSTVTGIKMDHWTMGGSSITMVGMFEQCHNLSSLTAAGLDTVNVTDMTYMFWETTSLAELDTSGWDTRNVTSMDHMFCQDSALTTLNVSGWDTSKVTNMRFMFYQDSALTTLNVSGWNPSSLVDADSMFKGVSSITTLDLSSWTTPRLKVPKEMFKGASSLTTLDLSGWDTNGVTDASGMFDGTSLQRIRLGANTGKLDEQIRDSVFPNSPVKTIYAEGAAQPTTFPDGSTTYGLRHFQSNNIPFYTFTAEVTQPTWFGNAKRGIQYTHGDGTVGDYPHPCLDWTGAGTCTIANSAGLTGSANRRLSWIDGASTAHIPGDTLTQDGFLSVTPQWNPMPVPAVTTVTWPHDLAGGSKSIRATGTATDLRSDDTIPVRFTWTDNTGTEQHADAEADIDGSNWTADLTDAPSFASIKDTDKVGTGTKVTVTARVKDAGGPLGYWSTGKDGYPDMVAPAVADAYAAPAGAGGVAMSSDRSQAVAEPGDTVTISWLDNTNTPISWPDGGGTTTTLTVTAGPGGRFTATKPLAVTGAKKVQYVLSDGINTSEPVTKKITDPITAIPLTGGEAQLWSKLLLILMAMLLIGATTTLRNRRNHTLRLVTPTGHTMPIFHNLTTNGKTTSGTPTRNHHANRHTTDHHATTHQSNDHHSVGMGANPSSASTAPSHAKLHHAAKHTAHGLRHTK